jgi:CelD/BcsL family acetyltransferase involved in cellulose biosynthesis
MQIAETIPAPRAPLAMNVAESFETCSAAQEEWDRMAADVGAPVYMSYDWARVWWQFYGQGSSLRLFTFSSGDTLVGVVPVYLSVLGAWPTQIRVARLVGSNIPPKIFNPPVHPEIGAKAWEAVLSHLFSKDKCDVVSLGPVSETYSGFNSLSEVAGHGNGIWETGQVVDRDVHTVYHLPKTLDELLAGVDRKELKTRRKKLRELESKGPLRIEVVKEPGKVEQEFEEFAEVHRTQWEAEGRPGHFHAWPNALEFNRELVKVQGKRGRVRFVRLLVGDVLVANQYNYAFGRNLYAELPSRATGPEWDRLSLGCSSQVKLLESAINEGFATMESGLGHYEYKVLLGGREHRAVLFRLRSLRASSRARVRVSSALRDLLVLTSQKLWYKRISPHLPKSMRRGQSNSAVSFDF